MALALSFAFCKHAEAKTEYKSRKYVAKILWLLSYDDKCNTLMDAIDKYSIGIQSSHWLPWISQLLCCLVQYEGTVILNLLSQVNYRNISLFSDHQLKIVSAFV